MNLIRKYFYLWFLCFQVLSAGALQQIQSDAADGKISSQDALVYQILLAHSPDALPLNYRENGVEPVKCGFAARAMLHQYEPMLSEEQRQLLRPFIERPTYLPLYYISPGGLFRLHYAVEGSNAVPEDDMNENGIPDFIEEGGIALDSAYSVLINQLEFNEPPQETEDGPEWDFYFINLNSYGYTEKMDKGPPYKSYVVLDNDFQGLYSSGLDGLRVTCAHEFFHMIQVGYQFRDSDIFFMEASATWVEDLVCDDVNDYLQYLDSIFNYDNTTFTSRTNLHEYGMSLWFHFLSDKYSTDIVKDIWEQVVTYPALHACHMALIPFATTLSDEIAEFYAWNLKTGSHADTLKYYSEGNLYPEQAISGSDTLTEVSTFRKTVQKTAARYLNIAADDQTTIIFAMVNANWESAQNQSDALLQVCLHDAEPYYYQITDSVFASLISDQGYGWRFVSCVRSSEIDGRPEIYPEFNASFFGSISGTAWIYQNQNEEGSVKVGTLPGVAISCLGAGEDHLFHTVDDKTYAYQLTNASGAFQFFGLVPGEYLITMDPENLPEPFVPNDTLFVVETYVDEGQDVEDIDFSFREIRETALPVCIPNPYCINNGPEMKIPFVLDTPDVIKFAVFSSQGFQIYYQETYFNMTDVIFLRWDGRVNGQPVPTGIYIYTIVCGNKVLRQEKIAIIQ